MTFKTIAIALSIVAICSVPAHAGSFGVYGSHWDSNDAGDSWAGGARVGFNFVKMLEFEVHGTQYSDFKSDIPSPDTKVKARALDGGLRVNFLPTAPLNPYVGAGVSYYFLDSNPGDINNKSGIYGVAGLDFGSKVSHFFVEAMWRKLDTTITLNSFNTDAKFDGVAGNAGFVWRWGT